MDGPDSHTYIRSSAKVKPLFECESPPVPLGPVTASTHAHLRRRRTLRCGTPARGPGVPHRGVAEDGEVALEGEDHGVLVVGRRAGRSWRSFARRSGARARALLERRAYREHRGSLASRRPWRGGGPCGLRCLRASRSEIDRRRPGSPGFRTRWARRALVLRGHRRRHDRSLAIAARRVHGRVEVPAPLSRVVNKFSRPRSATLAGS